MIKRSALLSKSTPRLTSLAKNADFISFVASLRQNSYRMQNPADVDASDDLQVETGTDVTVDELL